MFSFLHWLFYSAFPTLSYSIYLFCHSYCYYHPLFSSECLLHPTIHPSIHSFIHPSLLLSTHPLPWSFLPLNFTSHYSSSFYQGTDILLGGSSKGVAKVLAKHLLLLKLGISEGTYSHVVVRLSLHTCLLVWIYRKHYLYKMSVTLNRTFSIYCYIHFIIILALLHILSNWFNLLFDVWCMASRSKCQWNWDV